jgi:membrane peptidoglycan carboxypeptidase
VWIGYDQPRTIMAGGYASELAAPLWGRFMRTATRNDGRGWLKAPATVTSVRICPLSGQLATDACDGAYIEHFTHGAEPGELCPLHRTILGGTLRALADLVVPRSRASAEPVAPAPVVRVAPDEVPPSAAKVEEEPPRKRGFLSRIFGIGRGRSRR